MKPIEPRCLALAAYNGVSGIVRVVERVSEEDAEAYYHSTGKICAICKDVVVCHWWVKGVEPYTIGCEKTLTRIDGFEETEEIEEEAVA